VVINLKTVKALGLAAPPSLLAPRGYRMKPASSDRRPIHHSPIFWIGMALCSAAIAIYLWSSRGDRHRSHDEELTAIGSLSSPIGTKTDLLPKCPHVRY
jgi:hypothetical protein